MIPLSKSEKAWIGSFELIPGQQALWLVWTINNCNQKDLFSRKGWMLFRNKNLNDYTNEINIRFIILETISNDWIRPNNVSPRRIKMFQLIIVQ